MTIRYVTGEFLDEWDPTIEDIYSKQMDIGGHPVLFDILDTAGIEFMFSVSHCEEMWYKDRDVALLLFAIDRPRLLDECKTEWNRIIRTNELDNDVNDHCQQRVVILVGTKLDLLYNNDTADDKDIEIMRKNQRDAIELSKKWNVPYIETSAKDNVNIDLLFECVVREYWMQTQGMIVNWESERRY